MLVSIWSGRIAAPSFIQVDNAPAQAEGQAAAAAGGDIGLPAPPLKNLLNLSKNIWWNAVEEQENTDKYTAKTALETGTGIFYQSQSRAEDRSSRCRPAFLSVTRSSCSVSIAFVIVEEGAELNIISGCASDPGVEKGVHIGLCGEFLC